ncbi:MAG: hypothetical protein ACK52J_00550 [bacterium]|jgi:hypothetical protein
MFGGKKTIALNAHAIEQKVAGSNTLLNVAIALKKSLRPYLQNTL